MTGWEPPLPGPRGPLTAALLPALSGPPGRMEAMPPVEGDPLTDDDLHLALYLCYELHYRGFAGVDPAWEWDPELIGFRRLLETVFEAALRDAYPSSADEGDDVRSALNEVVNRPGPSLSRYLKDTASPHQFEEYLVHRSAYRLKEADPHSWIVPRLEGRPKAAMTEVLFDEFGSGRPDRIHALLYRNTMDAVGLDSRYGAYLDVIPGRTLASVNLMSLFGLHRRLTPAAVGHFAYAELTSALANQNVGDGLRRLGHGPAATEFFDEHVLADSVHDMIALHDLAAPLAEQDPSCVAGLVFGAVATAGMDAAGAQFLLDSWSRGEPTLRRVSDRTPVA